MFSCMFETLHNKKWDDNKVNQNYQEGNHFDQSENATAWRSQMAVLVLEMSKWRFYVVYVLSRFGRVRLFVTPWSVAHRAPLSLGFPRLEYWSGLPLSSPGDLPDPGIKPRSPMLQAESLPSEPASRLCQWERKDPSWNAFHTQLPTCT